MNLSLFAQFTESRKEAESTERMRYLRTWRRRFGFQCGQSFVYVKEYRSRENATPNLSFVVALAAEETIEDIERLVRTEILKRISTLKGMMK